MNKHFYLLLLGIAFSCWISNPLFSQTKAKIQDVQIQKDAENVVVTYDLIHTKAKERFDVRLLVIPLDGEKIYPKSTTGDVGEAIKGGKNRSITWEIDKDQRYINEKIYAEIQATPILDYVVPVSRGKALGLSAIMPGLGITKLNNGGAFWVLGIAFYGTAGASAYYYIQANSTYDNYLNTSDMEQRNKLYDQSKDERLLAQIFMYSASTIYVTNIIWTLAQRNKTKSKKPKFSFGGTFDPVASKPMLSFSYNF